MDTSTEKRASGVEEFTSLCDEIAYIMFDSTDKCVCMDSTMDVTASPDNVRLSIDLFRSPLPSSDSRELFCRHLWITVECLRQI